MADAPSSVIMPFAMLSNPSNANTFVGELPPIANPIMVTANPPNNSPRPLGNEKRSSRLFFFGLMEASVSTVSSAF